MWRKSTNKQTKTNQNKTMTTTNKRNLIINVSTWVTLLLMPNSEVKPFLIVGGSAAMMHSFPIKRDEDDIFRNHQIWNEYARIFPRQEVIALSQKEIDDMNKRVKEDMNKRVKEDMA